MTKEECRTELRHQLRIVHRLQEVGLDAAAFASRNKAWILLHSYKRHLREESVVHH